MFQKNDPPNPSQNPVPPTASPPCPSPSSSPSPDDPSTKLSRPSRDDLQSKLESQWAEQKHEMPNPHIPARADNVRPGSPMLPVIDAWPRDEVDE
jgi:hypothetical protein